MPVPRHLAVTLLLIGVCLAPTPAAAAPAHAGAGASATTTSTVSRSFTTTKRLWNEKFDMCIWTTFRGTVKATRYRYPASEGPFWVVDLKKPRLTEPRVSVTFRTSCADGAALKSRHAADTVRYAVMAYGYTCDYDPTYSVSAPWGLSVGVTPDCGDERVASHGDRQTAARSANRFLLSSDGIAVGWDGRDWVYEGHGTARVCTSLAGFYVLRDTQGSTRAKRIVKAGLRDQCVSSS